MFKMNKISDKMFGSEGTLEVLYSISWLIEREDVRNTYLNLANFANFESER